MNKKTSRKRPQQTKGLKGMGNEDMYRAMQELRRSSAASPHRDRARYYRAADKRMALKGDW